MKSIWKWIFLGLAIFLLAFCIALPLLRGMPYLPMRVFDGGRLWMHGGMMAGSGIFGWLGWIARLAIPVIGFLLLVYLVVALFRKPQVPPTNPAVPPAVPPAGTPCSRCGKVLEAGWVACPFCGKKQ
jgi:hypothetical protein